MRAALLMVCMAGCAAPVAEVAWDVCPVTRAADGSDIDDGGVDVGVEVRGAGARRVALGHFPGACHTEPAAEAPTLVCSNPHVDVRYELSWVRPSPDTLAIERREYAVPDADGTAPPIAPTVRRVVATFEVAGTRVTEGEARCP